MARFIKAHVFNLKVAREFDDVLQNTAVIVTNDQTTFENDSCIRNGHQVRASGCVVSTAAATCRQSCEQNPFNCRSKKFHQAFQINQICNIIALSWSKVVVRLLVSYLFWFTTTYTKVQFATISQGKYTLLFLVIVHGVLL